jgi:hypothetical protein
MRASYQTDPDRDGADLLVDIFEAKQLGFSNEEVGELVEGVHERPRSLGGRSRVRSRARPIGGQLPT